MHEEIADHFLPTCYRSTTLTKELFWHRQFVCQGWQRILGGLEPSDAVVHQLFGILVQLHVQVVQALHCLEFFGPHLETSKSYFWGQPVR